MSFHQLEQMQAYERGCLGLFPRRHESQHEINARLLLGLQAGVSLKSGGIPLNVIRRPVLNRPFIERSEGCDLTLPY
jgi:hypothetical protein